jgi:hypothetical protein
MTVVARAKTKAKPKAGLKAKASRWRLYYVTDAAEFECDFVIAKSAGGAERVLTAEYGDLPGDAELVIEIDKPPEWLTKSCWLGPDPDAASSTKFCATDAGSLIRRVVGSDGQMAALQDSVTSCRLECVLYTKGLHCSVMS